MRFFAPLLLVFFLLASPASAKILTSEPECRGFYAKVSRFLHGSTFRPEALPFDISSLEAAIKPELALSGHKGLVNSGLWSYSEKGRRYFVKSLGDNNWGNQSEIDNAKAMAELGVGPKVHSFRDDKGADFLIFDHVPGVNAKGIGIKFDSLEAPPEAQEEIRRALKLAPDASWEEVEKEYFSELYARREAAAAKLKEIRKILLAHDYYRLADFQFMIHFEKGRPGVEIAVIDSAYFERRKPRHESDALTMPLDKWIRAFERWPPITHQ